MVSHAAAAAAEHFPLGNFSIKDESAALPQPSFMASPLDFAFPFDADPYDGDQLGLMPYDVEHFGDVPPSILDSAHEPFGAALGLGFLGMDVGELCLV